MNYAGDSPLHSPANGGETLHLYYAPVRYWDSANEYLRAWFLNSVIFTDTLFTRSLQPETSKTNAFEKVKIFSDKAKQAIQSLHGLQREQDTN